ncbi:MAG: DNA-binding response regulator [Anaerocolumna sp.]|jgi:DNA-binding response OmpR family regulator|nr:DNA-binding response regulator [Anaerocolumna sp.]
MEKILLIEDDIDINQLIEKILLKEGYKVVTAFSGTEGELRVSMESFDLVLCDLMLPGISGEELIKRIRNTNQFPIIALTAKGDLDDKIFVLGLGADDYITKPFEPRELLARIQSQFRRTQRMKSETIIPIADDKELVFRDIVLIPYSMSVCVLGEKVELTPHEFAILKIMMENPLRVFSKEALYEAVWKNGYYGEDSTISVHISNIRKKILKITQNEYISTVWGIGYKLNL